MAKMTREKARAIFEKLSAANPAPETELYYNNPFTLAVAVALSAQATDEGVNKATKTLFEIADTPQKMAALGEKRLGEAIKTIGLWRNKAKNVIALSHKLIAEFGGEVPQTREELETLPGVGRKTANVVMNVAFGQPTIAVDTHIFRVGNRTGLAPGKNPLEVELGLEKIVPDDFMLHAHHWLILHGRYVCKARKPECWRCGIVELCGFKEKVMSPEKAKPANKAAAKPKKKSALAGKPKLRAATKKA
jgi:endonuclease-3